MKSLKTFSCVMLMAFATADLQAQKIIEPLFNGELSNHYTLSDNVHVFVFLSKDYRKQQVLVTDNYGNIKKNGYCMYQDDAIGDIESLSATNYNKAYTKYAVFKEKKKWHIRCVVQSFNGIGEKMSKYQVIQELPELYLDNDSVSPYSAIHAYFNSGVYFLYKTGPSSFNMFNEQEPEKRVRIDMAPGFENNRSFIYKSWTDENYLYAIVMTQDKNTVKTHELKYNAQGELLGNSVIEANLSEGAAIISYSSQCLHGGASFSALPLQQHLTHLPYFSMALKGEKTALLVFDRDKKSAEVLSSLPAEHEWKGKPLFVLQSIGVIADTCYQLCSENKDPDKHPETYYLLEYDLKQKKVLALKPAGDFSQQRYMLSLQHYNYDGIKVATLSGAEVSMPSIDKFYKYTNEHYSPRNSFVPMNQSFFNKEKISNVSHYYASIASYQALTESSKYINSDDNILLYFEKSGDKEVFIRISKKAKALLFETL